MVKSQLLPDKINYNENRQIDEEDINDENIIMY